MFKGVLKRTKKWWGGFWGVWGAPPGSRAGSEHNTLLLLTMTRDRPKFWNGPPWWSKVIIRETLAAEE